MRKISKEEQYSRAASAAAKVNLKHGACRRSGKSRTYKIWHAMRARCKYPSQENYHLYGGRGISVCVRWLDFASFVEDMGECPPGMTLDRINPDGDYTKDNCRWTDAKQQARNRRNNRLLEHHGKKQTLAEWAEELGISRSVLNQRLNAYGWSTEKALSTPVKFGQKTTHPRKKNRMYITYQGETKSVDEWAAKTGISRSTIVSRIKTYGWSAEKALTQDPKAYRASSRSSRKNDAGSVIGDGGG